MTENMCSVCAWRETCQKKFSVSGKDMRCAEFVKDVSIEKKEKEKEAGESGEKAGRAKESK